MKLFLLLFFLFINTKALAQKEFLNDFRINIEPTELYFKNILENNNYIIYSSKNRLLLYIHIKEEVYEMVFIGSQDDRTISQNLNKVNYSIKSISLVDHSFAELIFNKNKYIEGYSDALIIDMVDGLIVLEGLSMYFVYKEGVKEIYAEYILTTAMKPVPMDSNLYKYFTSRLLDIKL